MAREVGDGLLADALSFAPVAAEKDRRRVSAVRDFVDSIGHGNRLSEPEYTYNRRNEKKFNKMSWARSDRMKSRFLGINHYKTKG